MKMTKRILAAGLAAVMAFGLTACGGGGKDKIGNAATDIEIKYWNSGLGTAWLDAMIEAFEKEYPDYNVEYSATADVESVDTAYGLEDVDTVDLYLGEKNYDTSDMEPLNDVLDATAKGDSKALKDKFSQNYLKMEADAEGKYYGLTYGGGVISIVYNKKMFEEAGITQLPRTSDELKAACDKLSRAGKTPLAHYTGGGYWRFVSEAWLAQADGLDYYLNTFYANKGEDGTSPSKEALLKKDGRYDILKVYEGIITPEFVMDGSNTTDHVTVQTKFINGGAAMMVNGSWLDLYREHPGFAGVYGHDEPHSSDYSTRSDWENARVQMGDYQEASRLLSTTYDITCYENLLPYWENAATHSGDNAAEGYQAYLQDYITRYDPHHLSFDYYLFGVTEGFWIFSSDRDVDKSAEFMQNMVMIRNAAKGADIPFWSFVQAGANWNDAAEWMESTTNDTPTKGQFHWNVNIALTYGAQGIEYFPMIQPHYYAATSGGGMDYDRNGLLGADGTPTQWYTYAQEANKQIAAVDHVLMAAEHKGVIPVSGYAASQNKASTLNALGDENLVISKYGKLTGVTAEDTTYGAIVGCFDYNGKDAFYVTSYDVKNAQNVTLSFSESVSAEVIMKGATSQKTGTSMTLTLDAGEAALVVLN